MLALLINASINVDDDLYIHWFAVTNNQPIEHNDDDYNKIDHVLEYVVEVCFGIQNFFPEHRSHNHTQNIIPKAILIATPSTDFNPTQKTLSQQHLNCFTPISNHLKTTFLETDSPPPQPLIS